MNLCVGLRKAYFIDLFSHLYMIIIRIVYNMFVLYLEKMYI